VALSLSYSPADFLVGSRRLDPFFEQREVGGMPKKKEPTLPPKEQFKRFVETARKLDVDESGKEFERVFKKVVPPKRARNTK
jgi:hypothetical protein